MVSPTEGNDILATGYFVIDDSIAPPGPSMDLADTGLLIDFMFEWNGVEYDETTAMSGFAGFDENDTPNLLVFGDDCAPGSCTISGGDGGWSIGAGLLNLRGFMTYSFVGQPGFAKADIFLSGPIPVPIGPAAPLFLGAVGCLYGLHRRVKWSKLGVKYPG